MKKSIAVMLVMLLLLAAVLPVVAFALPSGKTVRVGWFPYPGSSEVHNGKYTGYTYDYLMEIAKYTDWKYEFVQADYATCTEMLKNGELDIIGGLQKSAQREAIYDYPDIPYGNTYSVLFTSKDSSLQPYDFEHFDKMNVGILKNTVNKDNIAQFAKNNGFSYNITEFNSAEEMQTALQGGAIDAALLASYVATENTRIIAKFAPMSVYLVTTKGNTEVLTGLNRALNYIKINSLYLDEELYRKHYAMAENMELTKEERAIVQASKEKPVTVGVIDNCAPNSYWNSEKNAFGGIVVEIFNSICKKTGMKVKYVPVDMSRRYQAATPDKNSPQLVLGIPLVNGMEDDRGWCLSNSLLEIPLAIVGRNGADLALDKGKKTVAVVKDFLMAHSYIEEKLPGWKIVEYNTLEDCMTAVANSEVDAAVAFQNCIIYYMQKPYFSKLKLVPTDITGTSLCAAGFTKNAQPLLQIVNKGFGRISDSELRTLTLNNTMLNTYPVTSRDLIYKYRVPLIVIMILLLTIIAVFIALYSVKRKSSKKLAVAFEQKNEALIEAEKAGAAKGNFMSRMSHEIRTPLNAIIGYNTIARNEMTEAKTESQRRQSEMKVMDCLTKSDIASRHLLTIINDVLDMSAIENGKISVINERFDFKGLISSLTAIFYSQARAKGVDFEVRFDSQMDEWIVGDQMRINQILTNLLSNAVKFTPNGGKVTLFIHPQTEQDIIKLHFEVSDTGIGMDENYLKRIWTPFDQADSSISRRFGGTGLGLSITKTLVDLLNGSISIESHVGKGSTFFVDLTFDRTEQSEKNGPYDFSSINALIVDDDISTCDYIRLLLTRSGVRSSAVYSGEEAIAAVKSALDNNEPYTFCLVDWHMPKMDGLETVNHIRRIAGESLPIIVITAYDFSEVADKAADVGVNMFISKPLFQSSLFNLLANISGSPVLSDEVKPTAFDFSGARVLLTEDNTMNMEIARKLLESAKLTVDCAWNGKEAVDMFLSAPPGTYSAILMDVQMPVMDGYQATKTIRDSQHPEAASVPIIAMTADAFVENIAASHAVGMNEHISKPIDLPSLFQTLKKFIH